MRAEELHKSILQLAIHGKLVEQVPTDEPASVLLERIRAEKEQLIKDKKIKRDKNDSVIYRSNDGSWYERKGKEVVCIDDEIPFEIPDSWQWCRLGNIGDWGAGATPLRGKADYYNNGTIPWLKTGELNNSIVYDTVEKITPLALKECSLRLNKVGDVLIAMYGATIGKLAIVGCEMTTNQACCACTPHNGIYNQFLFNLLLANKQTLIEQGEGGAQPNISREKITRFLIALPPIAEQERIVGKLEELKPLLAAYDRQEQELSTLNSSLPEDLKKSVLQYAIQGKLVAQDPADEPASELLARIRNEKEQLIKDKKIKRDKNDSVIYRGDDGSWYECKGKEVVCIDDEIPFEIPNIWEWCRLGELGIYRKGPFGSSLTKDMFIPSGENSVKVYEQKNAIQKDYRLGQYYISVDKFESMQSFIVKANDIIVSCAGTIGETYVLPNNAPTGIINQALMRVCLYDRNIEEFWLLYFDYILKKDAQLKSQGSAIKNIPPFDILKTMLVPIPPLAEQKRIVAKLEQILTLLNKNQ